MFGFRLGFFLLTGFPVFLASFSDLILTSSCLFGCSCIPTHTNFIFYFIMELYKINNNDNNNIKAELVLN